MPKGGSQAGNGTAVPKSKGGNSPEEAGGRRPRRAVGRSPEHMARARGGRARSLQAAARATAR
eukprot:3941900-Prymnesium_polylepis.1